MAVKVPSSLVIYCATWNVNGKLVNEDLAPWLHQKNGVIPDLYVVGFQEFDLTRDSFVSVDEERVRKWDEAILSTLSGVESFVQVGRQQLVGMLIILYARKDLVPLINDLDSDMIGTGYGGIFGNKGGVGIRFRIGNDTFCFVNSHLNAHAHNVERRNNDYKSICSRMVFSPSVRNGGNRPQEPMKLPDDFVSDDRAEESTQELPPLEPKALKDGEITVFDHDHLIWLGDLNYRIDLQREPLLEKIQAKEWKTLQDADQLKKEIGLGHAFQQFTESEPNFIPTYKYDSGTDQFDSSRKMRLPAYCDRILWRKDKAIQPISYLAHTELKISDHKPVSALIRVKLHPVAEDLRAELKQAPVEKNKSLGFPPKSYLLTTANRFFKSISPSTYLALAAVTVGVVAYLYIKS